MKQQSPLTVNRGSVTVKIYRQENNRSYTTFVVAHYAADGRLKRATFAKLEAARTYAQNVAERLNKGQRGTLVLQGAERLVYTRATEALEPLKIPLDIAAAEYAAATQVLKGKETLLEAVRLFCEESRGTQCHQGGPGCRG